MVSDSKEPVKDALPQGQPSEQGKETSEAKGEITLFTKEQVDKVKSDILSEKGREISDLQKQVAAIPTIQSQLDEARNQFAEAKRAQEAREYESVKESPDALKAWERNKDLSNREATLKESQVQLTRDQEKHSSMLEAANKVSSLNQAQVVGQKYGVPPELLVDQKTPELMEAFAQQLAPHLKGKQMKGKQTLFPDSGTGTGSGGEPLRGDEALKRGFENIKK